MDDDRCRHDLVHSQCFDCIQAGPHSGGPASTDAMGSRAVVPGSSWVPVAAVYKQHQLTGRFNPRSMELQVLAPPWSGRIFSSPTAAAVEVVAHLSPQISKPSTNSRTSWKVSETGLDLHSLVGQR